MKRLFAVCLHYLCIVLIGALVGSGVVLGAAPGSGLWTLHRRQAPQHPILSLNALADGRLVVDTVTDTEHLLHWYDGARWHLDIQEQSRFGSNPPIAVDSTGRLYFLANSTLVVYDSSHPLEPIREYSAGSLVSPVTASFGNDGTLYIASQNTVTGGLYRFDGTTVTRIRAGQTASVAVDTQGRAWVAHQDIVGSVNNYRLYRLENGSWDDLTDVRSDNWITAVTSIKVSPDSAVWINTLGTVGKLSIYRDGGWTHSTITSGGKPRVLFFDTAGGAWGYNASVLYHRLQNGDWEASLTLQSAPEGLNIFAASPDGAVWTIDGNTLYRAASPSAPWIKVNSPYDLGSDTVTTLAYTADGVLFCGHGAKGDDGLPLPYHESEHAGLSVYSDSTWYTFSSLGSGAAEVSIENVYNLAPHYTGEVLIASESGYNILFDGLEFSMIDSLYDKEERTVYVNDIAEDSYNWIWMGTNLGLLKYENELYPAFLQHPNLGGSPDPQYSQLRFDGRGSIYMRNGYGEIYSYNRDTGKWNMISGTNFNLADFDVEVSNSDSGDPWIISASIKNDYLKRSRDESEGWLTSTDTGELIELDQVSFVRFDEDGYLWASGLNNTGYRDLEGVWHRIPQLAGTLSNQWAYTDQGQIAFNAFVYEADEIHKNYKGVYVFKPGDSSVVEEDDTPALLPKALNYPNPFNAATTITFSLPSPSPVTVDIYTINGQRIRTLGEGVFPSGESRLVWDGRSDDGHSVSSGVYLFRIVAKRLGAERTGRMLLLR